MTLPEIQNALQRLLYIHPLADTNVDRVENVGANIQFQTDDAELERLRDELADREREVEELEGDNEILREQLREAERKITALPKLVAACNEALDYGTNLPPPSKKMIRAAIKSAAD